ncbi:serine/threonine-protein kinase SRPK [Aspergillus lentulus]|nr:serine/threonine-protein kinase SRPK [Aspergillus lentulus]
MPGPSVGVFSTRNPGSVALTILGGDKYRVLKVSTPLPTFPTASDRELKIYEHLSKVNCTHQGQSLIRELYDLLDLQGPVGKHRCLVMQPMHMPLLEMTSLNLRPFDIPLLKMTAKRLLLTLDFLHTEAEIIHTDLKTDNLMLTLEDETMLLDCAKAEAEDPSPRKNIDDSRTIYKSRKFRRPTGGKRYGLPVLCDFGEARIGKRQDPARSFNRTFIEPLRLYLKCRGAVLWTSGTWLDLFEGEHLLGDIFDIKGCHDPFKHLAMMAALIGRPPSEIYQTQSAANAHIGAWIAHEDAALPLVSLESLEKRLSGQEKELYLQSMSPMLKWLPEERWTARQLLEHPWLLE